MEYIEKEKLVNAIKKLMEARERTKNCQRQAAIEYGVFNYVLAIINKLEVHEAD